MEYKEFPPRARAELEAILSSGQPEEIADALLSAVYHDPDWQWAQEQCLSSLKNRDSHVRHAAIQGLGLVAVFHHQVDVKRVIPILTDLLSDAELHDEAADALDDIRINVPGARPS